MSFKRKILVHLILQNPRSSRKYVHAKIGTLKVLLERAYYFNNRRYEICLES